MRLSQADLARRVGVSPSTIFRYELEGGQLPPGVLLVALSEVLGVTPKALLGNNAKALPEADESPRVGRPPKSKEGLAKDMLTELRSSKPAVATQAPKPVTPPASDRRPKDEPE